MASSVEPNKCIGQFELLSMAVTGVGENQLLQIELEHSETTNIYDIKIDLGFVSENRFLCPYFDRNLENLKAALEEAQKYGCLKTSQKGDLILLKEQTNGVHQIILPAKKRQMETDVMQHFQKQSMLRMEKKMNELYNKLTALINQKFHEFRNQVEKKLYEHSHTVSLLSHSHHFSIGINKNGNTKITKKTASLSKDQLGFYSFILQDCIYGGQVRTLKVVKIQAQAGIKIGIATKFIFGQINAHKSGQCLVFNSDNRILQPRSSRYEKKAKPVKDYSTIEVQVDALNWVVKWYVDNEKCTSCEIPNHLRTRKLYFVIMMSEKGDQVQLVRTEEQEEDQNLEQESQLKWKSESDSESDSESESNSKSEIDSESDSNAESEIQSEQL